MPAGTDRNRQYRQFLGEAYRSFRKKQYSNASVILEKSVSSFNDDPYPLFLLAVCRLYSDDFSGANLVMEKLQRVNPSYIPFLQLRAFLGLKSARNREEAIAVYLNAVEKAPHDRLIKKGLRQCEDLKHFDTFQRGSKITDLVSIRKPGAAGLPEISFLPRRRRRPRTQFGGKGLKIIVLPAVAVIAVTTGIFLSGRLSIDDIKRKARSLDQSSAEKIDMVDINGSGYGLLNRINREPVKEFYASSETMITEFNDAKRLMKNGELNRAALILNKIINSNSSQVVKEKCEFLVRFIIDSDDRVYEAPDIKGIQEKPWLYRGTALELSGKTANVKKFDSGTGFTIMMDYDGKNFRWIAQVFTKKENAVENGDNVKVQGVYISGIGADNRPYITSARVTVTK